MTRAGVAPAIVTLSLPSRVRRNRCVRSEPIRHFHGPLQSLQMKRMLLLPAALLALLVSGCGSGASNNNSGVPTPGTVSIAAVVTNFTRAISDGNVAAAVTYLNPNFRQGPGCPQVSGAPTKLGEMICGMPKPTFVGVQTVNGSGDNATVSITLNFNGRKPRPLTLTLTSVDGVWQITQTLRTPA
jgi:hypothetical protein